MNPLLAALPLALTQAETGSGDPLLSDRLALRFNLPNTAPFDVITPWKPAPT
ncbi:MAG: hypothetical protein JSR82_04415 [Verrucomicrobia bacterium]|nr:hypothetical protein [Verrucomicrobiota bacterium]